MQSWKAESHSSHVSSNKINISQVTSKKINMRVESLERRSTCAKNVSEVANRCVFSMNRGSWCSKSRLAKAAGAEVAVSRTGEKWHAAVAKSTFASENAQNTTWAEPLFEVAMFKNGTRLWREAHLQVKMHKTPHWRSHFGSSDVQKLHAAVARSTFASQNVQNTTLSEPFWKFRCPKMPRGCGAKHICKCKMHKTPAFSEPFCEVPMFKNAYAAVARSTLCNSKCKKLFGLTFWTNVPN